DAAYATAVCTDVFEHLPNPTVLSSELFRILQPGGKALIGVPFLYWIHEQPFDYHRYTEFGLKYLFESAGFEVLEVKPYAWAGEVVVDTSGKGAGKRRLGRMVTATLLKVPKLGKMQGLSIRTAAKFPMGYTLVARKPAAAE